MVSDEALKKLQDQIATWPMTQRFVVQQLIEDYSNIRKDLLAYKNTGMTPERCAEFARADAEGRYIVMRDAEQEGVARLRELAEADKDGRLVALPAKTVFELTWDAGPDCDLICPVSIDGEGCCSFCGKGELCIYERKCRQEHIEQLGKTVFLTREEAEKALEAMK